MKKQYYKGTFQDAYIPVPESGCWLWIGNYMSDHPRYGAYGTYKHTSAHRYSYEIHKGVIPYGMVVRHTCDVRECVNPDHLILGSHYDNYMDSVERNRDKIFISKKYDTYDEVVAKHGHSPYSKQNVAKMPRWLQLQREHLEQQNYKRWRSYNHGRPKKDKTIYKPLVWDE